MIFNERPQLTRKAFPAAERQWGTMPPAQMLAHVSLGMEWAAGDRRPPRILLTGIQQKSVISTGAKRSGETPVFSPRA